MNGSSGIQKMKSLEEGLLSFGSRWSLSIVSCGLLSFISLSSFWIWASDSSIFNLGGGMRGRERFLIALRNFIPNAQVPGKAHDLGIYGARAICIGYCMLQSRVPDRFGREKRCYWVNIGRGGGVVTKSCLTLQSWTVAHQAPLSMGFPGDNTGVGCHFLLQDIFPTQDQTQVSYICRQILYHWATREALVNIVMV